MKKPAFAAEWAVLIAACFFYVFHTWPAVPAAGTAEEERRVSVPIIMYHSLLKDPARANDYVISPAVFEQDLQYLKAGGYETVVVQDLIDYVYNRKALPEKPVMITFDDGHLNNLTYGLPLLEKYDMRAVISVVGSYVEKAVKENDPNPGYAYVTWEDLKTMAASDRFEIQNHSYDLHQQSGRKGSARKNGEALSQYQQVLSEDLGKLQQLLEEKVGVVPTAFTYPYGYVSQDSIDILKHLGFQAALTCQEKQNYLTRDPDCLYQLHRYNRPSGISTYRFMVKALGLP